MMRSLRHIALRPLLRFWRDRSGAAFVEFAITLPLMVVFFAVTIDGARLMWSYQTTIGGVRDASRYLARVASEEACNGGPGVDGFEDLLLQIVRDTSQGNSLFPDSVTVVSVEPSVICFTGGFHNGPVAVAQVEATLRVTFPFGNIFTLIDGEESFGTVTTTVTDQARIFGT